MASEADYRLPRTVVPSHYDIVLEPDLSSGSEHNLTGLSGDLTFVRGDVCDAEVLGRAMSGASAVFHQAAVASVAESIADPLRCDRVNVQGTLLVLETARRAGVNRVVLAASAAAYGDDPELPKHESMLPRPLSPYAVSKIAGEHYVRVYAELHGMHTLSLRYFNVFGPRQDPAGPYAAVIPIFIARLLAGDAPTLYGDGEQTRDFCYIDNVVDANLRALTCEHSRGQAVNIANGVSTSLLDLLAMLGEITGSRVTPERAPARDGDIVHSRADITAASELLGYRPSVDVEEGLRRTVAHFGGIKP